MKNSFYLLCIAGLFLVTCKKKKPAAVETPPPIDEISYIDVQDGIINTIRTYKSLNAYCGPTSPVPSDSVAYFDIDVDGDNTEDFQLSVAHELYSGSQYCGHCPPITRLSFIRPLAPNAYLSTDENSPFPKLYTKDEEISPNVSWSRPKAPIMLLGCQMPGYSFFGYFGFKVGDKVGWIKISSSGECAVTVEAYALNKTVGNSIKAGQTK